ncbi:MAG: hypothetical protein ACLTT1_00230 [[Clostridium] scindens]
MYQKKPVQWRWSEYMAINIIISLLETFFSKNISLKMGQCPAARYVDLMLQKIQKGEFDATDIITHTLSLEEGNHAYSIFDKKEDNCIKVILKP